MTALWASDSQTAWRQALDSYEDVIAAQGVARLPELNRWYREELVTSIAARKSKHVTHEELVRVTEWKMARGVWRAPNLVLVEISTTALAEAPHPTRPIATLAKLDGVGPATASAAVAAYAPEIYPFFDELVAAQVPMLGAVKWTLGYYARYAEALRARASTLGDSWTPVTVERALWAHVGGKAGAS
jgi:hypothetical protein